MPIRSFLPPATCSGCNQRPHLGETLIHSGNLWVCAACLSEQSEGMDVMTKMANQALRSERSLTQAHRAQSNGEADQAKQSAKQSRWHRHCAQALQLHGNRLANETPVVQGEALISGSSTFADTLSHPDISAVESSESRGRLLQMNDVLALGVDLSNTVKASNTAEKILAHEVAVAHREAMEQARWSRSERDPLIAIKRLNASARMMAAAQQGLLTLQKLKASTPQTITVQHVHVASGAQAVVGNVSGRF